jgi:hypothetical protein
MYGENLAWSGPVRDVGQAAHRPKKAVHGWYSEIGNYNFNAPEFKRVNPGMNAHFTQVVWKASRLLGCAQATCRIQGIMQTLSVCKYDPGQLLYVSSGAVGGGCVESRSYRERPSTKLREVA